VSLVEQEILTLPEHMSSPRFLVGFVIFDLSFMCMFCRSFFVLLYFFFWPLCCLFFDIRIVITPLVIFKLFLLFNKRSGSYCWYNGFLFHLSTDSFFCFGSIISNLYNSSVVEKTNGMTFNPTFFKIDLLIYISPIECAQYYN
jgi:hypothetical protein